MSKRSLLIGLLVAGLVILCPASLFAVLHAIGAPAVWHDPPLYPGAQAVVVTDYGDGTYDRTHYVVKRIEFTTSDSPQQVLTFYTNVISGSWSLNTEPHQFSTPNLPNQFRYAWDSKLGMSAGLIMYSYYTAIDATQNLDGTTQVVIDISGDPD